MGVSAVRFGNNSETRHLGEQKNGIQILVLLENSFSKPVNKVGFFLGSAYVSKFHVAL